MNTGVELYLFQSQSQQWALTSGDEAVTHNDITYTPATIGRGRFDLREDISRADLQINVARNEPVALAHLRFAPDSTTGVTVFQSVDGGPYRVIWKGRVTNGEGRGAQVALTCESIFTSLARPGLRARFQRTCRHALYGRGCGLDPEDFAEPARAAAINGATVQVPEAAGQPNGWYLGGMLRSPDGLLRLVIGHVGDQVELSWPIESLTAAVAASGYGRAYGEAYGGIAVKLYPGCDHSDGATGCAKLGNILNNGAFKHIPQKNPFGGSSIV